MKRYLKIGLPAILLSVLISSPAAYAATSPSLGTASSFSILAETNITNVPSSSVSRDVGLSPASGSFIGLTDAEVGGTIYSVNGAAPPAANATVNPGLLTTAINDMTNVWSTGGATGIDQPCTTDWSGTGAKDLTTVSPLGPGVYCADTFLLTGNLTLSGSGVWIFKSSATLTTSAGSSITGGDPCNVWFRLVSAGSILGANSTLIGNILSGTSIAMQTGATLNGRLLSQAAVTLDHNTISGPTCAPTSTSTPTTGTTTPGLPNTGLSAEKQNMPMIVMGALALTVTAIAYFIRKRYSGTV
ncbi:MAG: periplasmic copper-binding [Marmoricola sp.]|nr:periplasmic copper-binding [Marmoricola sp.]